ncbi:unnamed protein product [Clonostachys rosea f. rosea IK726]|uniref:Uncharacterized protein n=1 Tax=Clonostachys rosea f. rosea IK726 TaxID=1349383 RepID=A0ACA9U9I7_BIOOC|nr:unnamed protein product [Clonostachys rosea f. rosea IK726]
MASNNVVLITGANRGIGRQMAASLLLRPATTVIATVRDPAHELSKSLSDLPASEGSKIIVSVFDAKKGPDALLAALADAGIQHLNLVISNAGNSDAFRSVLETDPSALRDDFEVNAVGPFRLFQGCWPLLSKAETGSDKKFVLITSSVGSIAGMEEESFPGVAYGASKAAANWLAKKIGTELASEGLQVGIIHPGWVKTGMGQALADTVGFPEPPMTIEDSSRGVLEQIDKLSSETSGKFLAFNGQVIPW